MHASPLFLPVASGSFCIFLIIILIFFYPLQSARNSATGVRTPSLWGPSSNTLVITPRDSPNDTYFYLIDIICTHLYVFKVFLSNTNRYIVSWNYLYLMRHLFTYSYKSNSSLTWRRQRLLWHCHWSLVKRYISSIFIYTQRWLHTLNIHRSNKTKCFYINKGTKQMISHRNYNKHRLRKWRCQYTSPNRKPYYIA